MIAQPWEAGSNDDTLDNGTIEIRENDVEIIYTDPGGQTWTVLYEITAEQIAP